MALDSVDFASFKKIITCGGRQYDEFSNFYGYSIWAEEDYWPSVEHYYQALKFPGAARADFREVIRNASSPMESWQIGNSRKSLMRKDWEEVKVNMMYQANFLKFSQSEHCRVLITESEGPICCDGGLFWKTWNEVILERIREELRDLDKRNVGELEKRVAMMEAYRSAAVSGDERAVDIVTRYAAKRELPPDSSDVDPVTVSGAVAGRSIVMSPDLLAPEINGSPHWISDEGWHLYLGKKNGRCAWVLDQECSATEASGYAFLEVSADDVGLGPCGSQQWQLFNDALRRHVVAELVVST